MYRKMSTKGLKVLVLLGSTRDGRLGERVAKFVSNKLTEAGHVPVLADPLELDLPLLRQPMHFYPDPSKVPENVVKYNQMVKDADAYVLVSAEYNRNMPPALTNMLDHSPPRNYAFKSSAIVTYSMGPFPGISVVSVIRGFMVEFGAPPIPYMFGISTVQNSLDADGKAVGDTAARTEKGVANMIKQLEWFADANRKQRNDIGELEWGAVVSA